ncbi:MULTISPECIES: bifunctional N-acetyltransferase/class I SAM-dependent methyltransferase [unclassified Fibrobacter]|uniref:bifunctional N-acetyltransferase/class I SAM-dependent methyltransferase n=1 Tax=unclassified Fibrobacter TaxID=2634177 RepID=UPI0009335118|nr:MULTISPECIES: bifunctional N-acetyltransferase/class I SAM-dependent methyltransferase [unclassified Fibrobacter]OWV05277.1 hypothetical protein B7993_08350 [Fibrobacter sp. UWH3]
MNETFITKKFSGLTEDELKKCSTLFSENYGKYSGKGNDFKKGQPIRMSVALYKKMYGDRPNIFASLCFDEANNLLGHAVFLRKDIPGKGMCSWVVQLVVHRSYRNRKIGSKLLLSAWGFSNYFAWGLATANAITIKTLESVTWRQVSVEEIQKNIGTLEQLMEDIPFVEKDCVRLSSNVCQVFSKFYPELEKSNKSEALSIYAKRLGELAPGNEWLAFTFSSQKMSWTSEKLKDFLEFSESQLKEAYSRMDMPIQGWTKGTQNEVDFILSNTNLTPNSRILDLGCGQGRHVIELARRGYTNVTGIDFSERNIIRASSSAVEKKIACNFMEGDARTFKSGVKYDCICCLYDVIGSFRNDTDNLRIIRNLKQLLTHKGRAIISVMNMALTKKIATNIVSLNKKPEALLKLPPSETMKVSGNIFKPEYFLINKDDGLVYRKEQFSGDEFLLAEYVVADKRYHLSEIKKIVQDEGLKIVNTRFVSAGAWDKKLTSTDSHAKEILLVLEHA